VSWNIQPVRSAQNAAINMAWQPTQPWQGANNCAGSNDPTLRQGLFGCSTFAVQRGVQGQAATVAQVPVLFLRAPKATLSDAAGRWRDAWTGPGLAASVEEKTQVAVGTVKTSGQDVLQNISSGVMLKAQDKVLDGARVRMQGALGCQKQRPFPQTCELLGTIRLSDLLVIGDTLQEVLLMKGLKPTDKQIAGAFVAMTSVYADAAKELKELDAVGQGAVLAMAVMGECMRMGDCSGKKVFSLVRQRDAYFELGQNFQLDEKWWPEKELIDLIGRGLAVLQPTQRDASLERAMALSQVTFSLVRRHMCAQRKAASLEECEAKQVKPWARLQSAEHLVEGAILNDAHRGLLALNEILSTQEDERRMMAALGSFIVQAPQDKANAMGAGARTSAQERLQSLDNLVQALSQRQARKGDFVFGIHGSTSLGLTAGSIAFEGEALPSDPMMVPMDQEGAQEALSGFQTAGSVSDVFAQPLSLTLGLSVQKFLTSSLGFSASLDILELGRWASFTAGELNSFEWSRALYPALTVGLLIGDADLPVFVGARGGYSPFDNVAFVGANFGVYVPLLDFN
jgi:hypothetical protein